MKNYLKLLSILSVFAVIASTPISYSNEDHKYEIKAVSFEVPMKCPEGSELVNNKCEKITTTTQSALLYFIQRQNYPRDWKSTFISSK